MDIDSNQKRQRQLPVEIDADEVNIDTPKRNKVNETVKDKVKITSLNDDCLGEIFKFLELTDLIAVISASKHFSNSVCSVFLRKYGKGEINITNCLTLELDRSSHDTKSKYDCELNNVICSPQAVKTMRNFGHLITKMNVKYDSKYRRLDHYIEDAIIKYCRESLVEILFINADYFTLFQMTKPFPNVLKVIFNGGKMCKFISNFNKWFPRVESLDLVRLEIVRKEEKKVLFQHFSNLRHLGVLNRIDRLHHVDDLLDDTINYHRTKTILQLQSNDLLETIDFNPQLKSLTLNNREINGVILGSKILAIINKKLPELTDLDLTMLNYHMSPSYNEQGHLNFKALKRLRLEFENSYVLSSIPIIAHEVEYIELESRSFYLEPQLGHECSTFLEQNQNVKILIIRGSWVSSQILIDTIMSFEKLRNLSELIINTTDITIQSKFIVNMINNCKSLTKLHISVDLQFKEEYVKVYEYGFNQIVASIGTEWNSKAVTYDPEYLDISLNISKNRICMNDTGYHRKNYIHSKF